MTRCVFVLFYLLAFVLIESNPLWATPQVKGREGREFIPNGGYLRTTKQLYLSRRIAERGRGLNLAPGVPLNLTGSRSIPVICVQFKNVSGPFAIAEFQEMLFGGDNIASMTRYYQDISQNRFSVMGTVHGWVQAPKEDVFYENGENGGGAPFGEFLELALAEADLTLDFGQYDNDGRDGLPNSGDDDGIADTVLFIHPEKGAECDGDALNNIWSHSWHYSEPDFGHTQPFTTNDNQLDESGQPVLRPDGSNAKIMVEDYTIQPALSCSSTVAHPRMIEVGVFCHEYGHALGLPDLYDRTPKPTADSAGVGHWCLMASGSYGGDGNHSERPTRMSAWCKYYLGWAKIENFSASGAASFEPVRLQNQIYRFNVPGTNNLEFFLIELRTNGAASQPGVNWDEFLPSSGLAIWHVDERVGSENPIWPFAANDRGQNDSPIRVNNPQPPLFKDKHPLVAIVQADGKMHLESSANRGDNGDLYQTGSFKDDPLGKAGSRDYSGKKTDFSIAEIQIEASVATGTVSVSSTVNPVAAAAISPQPQQEETRFDVPALHELEARIAASNDFAFSDDEISRFDNVPRGVLRKYLTPRTSNAFLQQASDTRTKRVNSTTTPTNDLEAAAQRLVQRSPSIRTAIIRVTANRKRVELATGLELASEKPDVFEDAAYKIDQDQDLRHLLNIQGSLKPMTVPIQIQAPTFRQIVQVSGESLPIFNAKVSLHYNSDNRLVAASSSLVDTPTDVIGTPSEMSYETAKNVASEILGLPETMLQGGEQGILLVRDDPSNARVAYQFSVPAGPKQKPIQLYLGVSDAQILEIK